MPAPGAPGAGAGAAPKPPAAAAAAGFLELLPPEREMAVDFLNVSCWVPAAALPPSAGERLRRLARGGRRTGDACAPPPVWRQILRGVSGAARPGEVLALMGPSGSGKTTLLSLLGGRAPAAARQAGSVLFNDAPLTKGGKRAIGYVLQDDLLYAALTVWETLYFAAMLRLPAHQSTAEKLARVESVIAALGLQACRDTAIGDGQRRGVSGGERKRVSVGHELLINPSAVFLDEPTSGLDSTTALHLVEVLRRLARGGRVVITTIHQPSSRLYQRLDALLLLSQGHVMYSGRSAAATEWFERLGKPVPFGTNVADFILDLSNGEDLGGGEGALRIAGVAEEGDAEAGGEAGGEGGGEKGAAGGAGEAMRRRLVEAAGRYLRGRPAGFPGGGGPLDEDVLAAARGDSPAGSPAPSDGGGDAQPEAPAGALSALRRKFGSRDSLAGADADAPALPTSNKGGGAAPRALARSATSMAAARPGASRWGASYFTQLRVLFARSVRARRFEAVAVQDVVQFTVVGAVAGMIWWRAGLSLTLAGAEDALGLLFFEALFLSFRSMFNALFTFPQERSLMLKERASGMYRLSAFYLARTASDLPLDFATPSILVVLAYLMARLRPGWWFFANAATCLLATLVAQSFGLLVGATVMVAKTAQTLAAVIMLTCMLCSGFYAQNIPVWIGWIKWVSFLTYSYSLLIKVQYGSVTLYDCEGVANVTDAAAQCPPVADKTEALGLFIDPDGAPWEAAVLLGFLLLFRVLVYYALRLKTTPGGAGGRA